MLKTRSEIFSVYEAKQHDGDNFISYSSQSQVCQLKYIIVCFCVATVGSYMNVSIYQQHKRQDTWYQG